MRTFSLRVAVALALAALLAPASSAARPPGSPDPAPDRKEIQRLFEAPGTLGVLSSREVSVAEVVSFAAAMEGISFATAYTRVTGGIRTSAVTAAAAPSCSWTEYEFSRGIFPYYRQIVGQTYWCYADGVITYRSSHTAPRVNGVCSGNSAREWKVSGGAGYPSVVVHHEASFSCVTPWWFPLNDSLWMEIQFNAHGQSWPTRWG